MKKILIAALMLSASAASADISKTFGTARNPNIVGATSGNPHPGWDYKGQHYVTPAGCSYSRAQAPGYHPTWHLILNGAHVGLTNAHKGCPMHLGNAIPVSR
jgi:hypothetical protein